MGVRSVLLMHSTLLPVSSAPADFAKGKMFGAKALKAGMLQHSKDAIPTSLTKLAPDAQVLSGRVMMIN